MRNSVTEAAVVDIEPRDQSPEARHLTVLVRRLGKTPKAPINPSALREGASALQHIQRVIRF